MADPAIATARLQVIGMTCDFAGSLPATRLPSDMPYFERRACTGRGCSLTVDAPRVLHKATEVIAGFMNTRIY